MKRSKFSLSHYKNLTCNMGQLVPVGMFEVLPGDTVQQATSLLTRVSPLLAPVMHPVHMRIHHWFVPYRLIWEDWEKFITGGPDGMDASVFPTITFPQNGPEIGTLADYLGVPPDNPAAAGTEVSALPFRAYAKIWNEFYRDQDLETELTIDLTSGPDTTTSVALQNCAWEKDYFTSARPWTQKGPEVTLPLGTDAPVRPDGTVVRLRSNTVAEPGQAMQWSDSIGLTAGGGLGNGNGVWFGNTTGLKADLSDATAATINDLRLAMALQRYEEARARYGSRYTEYLRYLGVRSSDARLQRPEYLGGGKQTIQFSEVLQTSPSEIEDSEFVGDMKGHGIGAMRSNRYRRFFEEHGVVISLVSAKPRTMYVQGLPRMWNRRTKEDFWQRELQHIGQQEVLNKELYAKHTTPDGVFGYQDRYDEYRRMESSIAGEFRNTLDYWHMARIFSSDPALNAAFVKANPTDRIYAGGSAVNQLLIMANHSIQARRLVAPTGHSYIY